MRNIRFIAHRGLSSMETENTAAAFVAAGNTGFFGIEADVRLTSDGVPVIIHDDDTKRVATENFVIEKTDYETLCKINLNDTGGKGSRRDLVIPRVDEFISICKRYGKCAFLELKAVFDDEGINKLIEDINRLNYLDETVFISFNRDNLSSVRSALPNQRTQLLTTVCNDELLSLLEKEELGLALYYRAATPELIDKIHRAGLVINCWTVDSPDDIKRLSDMDVDYITTNKLIIEV